MRSTAMVIALCSVVSFGVVAKDKHHEDPTRIVTKAGIAYTDSVRISGSIGLDEARMINARTDLEGEEWRIGGSWLLPMGILNFNFSRSDYDDGAYKNNYSIGTFVPLTHFGFEPAGWQIFPMAGYSYNDGEFLVNQSHGDAGLENDYVLMPASSHGGYLGGFAVKPLTDKWSLMAFGGGSMGSDNYSGHWYGAGVSHKLTEKQSFNIFGYVSDDSFGDNSKIGGSYTYEF